MSHAASLTERWDRTNSWVGTEELNSTNSCRSHQNYCRRTVDTLQIILVSYRPVTSHPYWRCSSVGRAADS